MAAGAATLLLCAGTWRPAPRPRRSIPGEQRDFAFKVGIFVPSEKYVRAASATEIPVFEADYTIQKYPESHFNSILTVGYIEHENFRMIPITVSQIYRDPENAAGVNYYYGLGAGLYETRLNLDSEQRSGEGIDRRVCRGGSRCDQDDLRRGQVPRYLALQRQQRRRLPGQHRPAFLKAAVGQVKIPYRAVRRGMRGGIFAFRGRCWLHRPRSLGERLARYGDLEVGLHERAAHHVQERLPVRAAHDGAFVRLGKGDRVAAAFSGLIEADRLVTRAIRRGSSATQRGISTRAISCPTFR